MPTRPADHPKPAVAQFPHTGFSHLADQPLLARAIHALALRRALPPGAFHRSTLLAFYFRHRSPAAALHLFDAMPDRTPPSPAASAAVSTPTRSIFCEAYGVMRSRSAGSTLTSLVTSCERWGEEGRACGAAIHAFLHLIKELLSILHPSQVTKHGDQ